MLRQRVTATRLAFWHRGQAREANDGIGILWLPSIVNATSRGWPVSSTRSSDDPFHPHMQTMWSPSSRACTATLLKLSPLHRGQSLRPRTNGSMTNLLPRHYLRFAAAVENRAA